MPPIVHGFHNYKVNVDYYFLILHSHLYKSFGLYRCHNIMLLNQENKSNYKCFVWFNFAVSYPFNF